MLLGLFLVGYQRMFGTLECQESLQAVAFVAMSWNKSAGFDDC